MNRNPWHWRFAAALAAASLFAFSNEAGAQSNANCQRLRAELASLERAGPGGRGSAFANQNQAALAQAIAQYRSHGCDRRGIFGFSQPPPQCGPLGARISQLQMASAQASASLGIFNQRRAHLIAAINQHCAPPQSRMAAQPQQPQPPRSLFEALFGTQPAAPPPASAFPMPRGALSRTVQIDPEPLNPAEPIDPEEPRTLRVSGKPVCVRLCDGFFFPLSISPANSNAADEMCQALCPATQTQAYYIGRDGEIEGAVRGDGTVYTDLPNASKFRRSFDASCSCRRPGESWRSVLAHAESLLETRKTDVVVTTEKSEELSRPTLRATTTPEDSPKKPSDKPDSRKKPRKEAARKAASPPDPKVPTEAEAPAAAPIETAVSDGAGIANQKPDQTIVPPDAGEERLVTGRDGEIKKVRIVGPKLRIGQ